MLQLHRITTVPEQWECYFNNKKAGIITVSKGTTQVFNHDRSKLRYTETLLNEYDEFIDERFRDYYLSLGTYQILYFLFKSGVPGAVPSSEYQIL